MLTIRKEQLAVFGPLGKKAFADRMLVHLKKNFPEQCALRGDPKLLQSIEYGTQRAACYHITSERDVCKYIDVMILYGQDFDKDSRLPWASSILRNQAIRNSSTKIERLYKAAKNHDHQNQPARQP